MVSARACQQASRSEAQIVSHLSAKKLSYMGFHGVSAKNLVDHLMERYETIWASDLEAC